MNAWLSEQLRHPENQHTIINLFLHWSHRFSCCSVSQFCNPVICTFHKKLKPKASSGRIFALDPVTTLRRVSHPMELLYQQFVHLHTTSLTDYQARHAYQYYTHRTMEGRAKVSHQAQVPWSVVTGDWGQRGKASRRIAWLEIWPKVRSKKMLTGYQLVTLWNIRSVSIQFMNLHLVDWGTDGRLRIQALSAVLHY